MAEGSMHFEAPAVVLGGGVNGLGVVRSLARARVTTWLLDSNERRPEMYTCAAKSMKINALYGETLIEELVRLGATKFFGLRPVLFLTQEESVKTVSHNRERLNGLYRFSLPSEKVLDTLLHKQGFQCLAEQFNAPIPPLAHVRTLADMSMLENLHYPVVVKPGERNAEYGLQFKKAYRVASAAEASELLRRILPVMPDVVVQEWIDGPDSNIYFCLQYLNQQAQPVATFTGRKIRSWPPQVGGTASCMPAPEAHTGLSAMTTQFFQSAGVVGMAGMEYKRDARSGEFRMVEPTIGRTDYQEEVATLNGVNLPYVAYCSELGMPSSLSVPSMRSLAWRVRSEDEQSAASQNQRPGGEFASVGKVVDAWWRWSDPMPCLVQGLRRAERLLRAWTTRLLSGSPAAKSKS